MKISREQLRLAAVSRPSRRLIPGATIIALLLLSLIALAARPAVTHGAQLGTPQALDAAVSPDAAAAAASGSVSFQNGVAPSASYAGGDDTYISQANPGTNYGATDSCRVDGDDPPGTGQDVTCLLRWDISAIPAGSTVTSASITVYVTNPSVNQYPLYQGLRSWNEAQATWQVAASGQAWGAAGATSSSDRGLTVLGALNAPAIGFQTLTLNAAGIAVLQGWVNTPSSNRGLVLADTNMSDGADFLSGDQPTVSQRPQLTISYTTGSTGPTATPVTPVPPTATPVTPVPPTATSVPPTATRAATNTPVPATATPPAVSGSVSFQNGVAPSASYAGGDDTYIAQANPTTNYGATDSCRIDGDDPPGSGQDQTCLLRWDTSSIPAGSTVTGASITLYVTNNSVNQYPLYQVLRAWNEAQATWQAAASGQAWGVAGATASSDRGSTVLGTLNAPAIGFQTLNLNAAGIAVVQGWVNNPSSNRGLVLVDTNVSDGAHFLSGDQPTLSQRPKLTISYTTGSTAPTATPAPATATPSSPTATSIAPTATRVATNTPLPPTVAPTATPGSTCTAVRLTKGPNLILTGNNTQMKVVWQWTTNTTFTLRWGTSTSYASGSLSVTASDTTNHMYTPTISGLTPGTKYFYQIAVSSQCASASFFAPLSSTATSVKFTAYGDTRTNPGDHDKVAAGVVSLFKADPAFQTLNLNVGDWVNSDGESNWVNEWYNTAYNNIVAQDANLADTGVRGNHEGGSVYYARYFPQPYQSGGMYRSFDYGPMHVVELDQYASGGYGVGSAQYNWLQNDLATSTKMWKVVVLHEPGWSAGGGHEDNTTVQSVLEPLFKQYGVSLVLAGHNHYYARATVDGIQHLTVGGGGAPLYVPNLTYPYIVTATSSLSFGQFTISGNTLTAKVVTDTGRQIDSFTITR